MNVYVQIEGSPPLAIWSLSGEQPDGWWQGKAGFTIHADHSLLFEAKITSLAEGDIALDDISITNGACPTFPPSAIPIGGLTTTTIITTPMLVEFTEDCLDDFLFHRLGQLPHIQHRSMIVILKVRIVLRGVSLANLNSVGLVFKLLQQDKRIHTMQSSIIQKIKRMDTISYFKRIKQHLCLM